MSCLVVSFLGWFRVDCASTAVVGTIFSSLCHGYCFMDTATSSSSVASTCAVARAWKPADADDVLPCVSPISTTLVRDSLCLVQR